MNKNQVRLVPTEQPVRMQSQWEVQEVTTDGEKLPVYTLSTENLLTIWYYRISEQWLRRVMNCPIGEQICEHLAIPLSYPEQNCTVKSIWIDRLS